ncbi:hypothetical protein B0H19DRAFT_1257773 [Mycena capillaripes]|nr:hypothetical protein B0H19DRAFT_1257773 [Mycena capillaripes]
MSSLSAGCAANFPGTGGAFAGCSSTNRTVLETCCSSVGSTAASLSGTCGCPFNSVFNETNKKAFLNCAGNAHDASACNSPNSSVATALPTGCSASNFEGPETIPKISGGFLGAYMPT